MLSHMCKQAANGRFLLCIASILVILALIKENVAVVKRDTTIDNVKAMFNRFVSPSTGKAKYVSGGKNACSLDVPPSVTNTPGIVHVAASKDDFQSSLGCGVCLKITGSGKPAAADLDGTPPVKGTLKAIVVDEDDSLSQGDLALLPPQSGSGLWEINFKAVDCPTGMGPAGFIQLRFTSSNEMYFKLQAMNAKVPVAGIEAFERVAGKWVCLTKTPDNFFSSEGMGAVSFPLKIRLTSIMNEQLEATVDALKNDVLIKSDIQFSDTEVRGGSPEGIKCFGQGDRPASEEGDVAFCVGKEDGIYADPQDQTAFYMCKGEKATKKFCPTGLKFNPTISSCDVPEDVRFTGNDVESPDDSHSKETTRWSSLPSNDGLKVFSVGGPEESKKYEDKTIPQAQQPHKIFSINIFNGSHVIPNAAAENEKVYRDKGQSIIQNSTAVETRLTKDNSNVNDDNDSRNVSDHMSDENTSSSVAEEMQAAINANLESTNDQLQTSSHHVLSTSDPASKDHTTSLSASSKFPESAGNLGNKNHQSVRESGKTIVLPGHLRISPHKLFAINVFGLHPKAPPMEDKMYNTNENTRLSGDQSVKPENRYDDGPIITNKVPVQPLYSQEKNGEVSDTSGIKSEYQYERQSQPVVPGIKPVEDQYLNTNEGIGSKPLHFKLKVQMDKSGKQSAMNCTLSECSENDFAIEDDKSKGKGTQTQQSDPLTSSTGEYDNKDGSPENENDKEFHITLNTIGSEPLRGLHVIPIQSNGLQTKPSAQAQEMKFPTELEDSSQVRVPPPNVSLVKETQELSQQFSEHNFENTATLSNLTTASQETTEGKSQGNLQSMEVNKEDQQDDNRNETKVVHLQQVSTNESSISDGLTGPGFPLSKTYEGYIKTPSANMSANSDKELENTYRVPVKENVSGRVEEKIIPENYFDTNVQSSSQLKTSTINQLPQSRITNHFRGDFQLGYKNFLPPQTTAKDQPQLKIILKNPGKLGRFLNSGSQLNRRSGARGHIVQILKSLIDRPLQLGPKNREDVVSKLSSIVSKSMRGGARGKTLQSDLESIQDSGSIAQSILEANKEYLDDIAMQGMVFSNGDPETENMTDIADSIKKGREYLHQSSEFPQWENQKNAEQGASTEFRGQRSGEDESNQFLQKYDDYLSDQVQDDGDESSSASGMGEGNGTLSSYSNKTGKYAVGGSGGSAATQDEANKEAAPVTVGKYGPSEVNAYKGGNIKANSDPKLKSFCIGKSSGTYTNPFDQKSFVICSNGESEERECPERTLFNPKEKICDVPDKSETRQRNRIGGNVVPENTPWKPDPGKG